MATNKDFKVKNGIQLTGQLTSTVATGTAPLVVSSTTLVTNLNADLHDGMQSASTNTASTIVNRDASGNFSAGTITATGFSGPLTGNVTGNVSGTAASITGVYSGTITSAQVTTGLGFTPYNSTNPSGYTSNTGTVTSVSVASANGISGTVATNTTTPAITLTLGAITPTSVTAPTGVFSTTLTVAGLDVGTKNVPQNIQSVAYTTVLADNGRHILHPAADTTARIYTIPTNATVAYPIGAAITFVNQNGAGAVTIACGDTMRLAGAGTTGNRTLAANGMATALKITATEWIINGTNLT